MKSAMAWTNLRDDLDLYNGTRSAEGLPTWVIHDRWRNRFVNIGWLEYELLKRWHLQDPVKIAQAVCEDTTLHAVPEDIAILDEFLKKNELVSGAQEHTSARLIESAREMRETTKKKAGIMKYLFVRIPLFRPDNFLQQTLWMVKPLITRRAFHIFCVAGFLAILLVLQQWHIFLGYVKDSLSWQGFFFLTIALAVSKSIHELGHAYTCKRFGLKVATIGLMLMLIFPFFYTDTTESWKLESRKKRLAIGIAGVTAELGLAIIATWLWVLLPDSGVRFACFYLATASWIATIAINISPFLRWDGYWVLSDLIGIQNLRERSNKLAKWNLGRLIMGFDTPKPGAIPENLHAFVIVFAYFSWVYRIGVFLLIGGAMYAMTFKLLGIFFMAMMITKMALGPIAKTLHEWWQHRSEMHWNRHSISAFSLFGIILLVLIIPWRASVLAPAILAPEYHVEVFPGEEGEIEFVAERGASYQRGDILFRMKNSDLAYEKEIAQRNIEYYKTSLQRMGNQDLLEARAIDREQLQTASSEYVKFSRRIQRLGARAPFDGEVIWVNELATQNGWMDNRTPILTYIDRNSQQVYAYVDEYDLERIQIGGKVSFYPENSYFSKINGKVLSIDEANTGTLDYDILATSQGGKIPAERHQETGKFVPTQSIYRVRIQVTNIDQENDNVSYPLLLRGYARLAGERKSIILRVFDSVVGVIIRESGF